MTEKNPRKPVVLINRNRLLSSSETFVRSQAEALQRFVPYYVGSRLIPGISLPEEQTLTINEGNWTSKVREIGYRFSGFAPIFLEKLRKLNPRLMHTHFGPDAVLVLRLVRHLQIPLIVTFHGYDVTVNDIYAWRSSYSHLIYILRREVLKREARLFIAVSKFLKKKLLAQDFPPDKIIVHYIGVDTKLFQPSPKIQRQPIVLFVGRLVEKKGCEYLIKAMGEVQKIMPEVKLLVIGDGPLRHSLEKIAKETLRQYQFLGTQPSDKVRLLMNQSQVFSVPSVTAKSGDSEAFGIVFAEAQAMGLPVVSFAHGGIPEAVAHGETGFLATEGNWEELAKYIIHLQKDKALWQKFSRQGQKRMRTFFDLSRQTDRLEEIYLQLLGEENTI